MTPLKLFNNIQGAIFLYKFFFFFVAFVLISVSIVQTPFRRLVEDNRRSEGTECRRVEAASRTENDQRLTGATTFSPRSLARLKRLDHSRCETRDS